MSNIRLDRFNGLNDYMPRLSDRDVEGLRWLNDFIAEMGSEHYRYGRYGASVADIGSSFAGSQYIETRDYRMRPLISFVDDHYCRCPYFNGFSISRRGKSHRDSLGDRNSDIILGCSCGERIALPEEIWKCRMRGMDLEDCIQDLNYQAQHRSERFIMRERFESAVKREVEKREAISKTWARDQGDKKRANISAISGLEIQDI